MIKAWFDFFLFKYEVGGTAEGFINDVLELLQFVDGHVR